MPHRQRHDSPLPSNRVLLLLVLLLLSLLLPRLVSSTPVAASSSSSNNEKRPHIMLSTFHFVGHIVPFMALTKQLATQHPEARISFATTRVRDNPRNEPTAGESARSQKPT